MAWQSTDPWAGVDEGTTAVRMPRRARRRSRAWPAWVLTTLAFVCGALVSAAVFTIGWRHQTQQNAAAQSALADANARNRTLAASLSEARTKVAHDQRVASKARAALQAARASAATIAAQASAAQNDAAYVSGDSTTLTSAAGRIASELKTLTTYLTTTPTQQLDAGYIDSQAAYLVRQMETLQSEGGTTTTAAANFEAAVHRLAHLAAALAKKK